METQPVVIEEGEPIWTITRCDALKGLESMADGSVDLIVTDPPYESLEKHRKQGGTTGRLKHSTKSSNDWFDIFPNKLLGQMLFQFYRVLAKNSHCYIMCDDETSNWLWHYNNLLPRPFKWWKRIVWDKEVIGMGYHYRARFEFIVFLEKGKRKIKDLSIPDILQHKRIFNGYPAQKPVALMETLITQSTEDDALVLDPFMGSGTTGVAAIQQDRRFIGFDKSKAAQEVALARLMEAENGLEIAPTED